MFINNKKKYFHNNLLHQIKKIILCLLNPNFLVSYINRVCPLFELKNFLIDLKEVKNLIDIGSNKGQFLLLFNYYFPQSKIYSFEPQKKYLNIQKKIIKKNIKFFNLCLGNKNCDEILNITNKEDSSSILTPKILKKSIYKIKKKLKIKVRRLDDIIDINLVENILLKIDVQGYEKQVLLGSKKILKKTKYIIIELSNNEVYKNQIKKNEIIKYLKKLNFKIVKTSKFEILNKNALIADYLFVNKKFLVKKF